MSMVAAHALLGANNAPSIIDVFRARAEARAILLLAGELDLHTAVDVLQYAAVDDGLVARVGQDEVQRILGEAFGAAR